MANFFTEIQRRFLDAYRQRPRISCAARLAGVHRASVYRWRTDAGFVEAMRAVAAEFYQEHRAKVLAEEAARERWRDEQRRPKKEARFL